MSQQQRIKVWDLPTRLFHWLLVLCFCGLWYTGKNGDMGNHFRLGYTMLGLLLFRCGWGFAGGRFSRFRALLLSPAQSLNYLRNKLHTSYPGHNPLGSWGVVFILLGLTLQVMTGLFANDTILAEGPLVRYISTDTSSWLTSIHSLNFDILLWILGFHIAAVLFHTLIKREDILPGMITGYRQAEPGYHQPAPGSWEHFTLLLLLAVMVISWLADLS